MLHPHPALSLSANDGHNVTCSLALEAVMRGGGKELGFHTYMRTLHPIPLSEMREQTKILAGRGTPGDHYCMCLDPYKLKVGKDSPLNCSADICGIKVD